MKKAVVSFILLFIIIASIIALIAPNFAGNRFNTELDNFVEGINSQPFYQAKIENRQHGWFSTKADLIIRFDMDEIIPPEQQALEQSAFAFSFPINAQHGPMLTQSGFSLGWVDWIVNVATDEPIDGLAVEEDAVYLYSIQGVLSLFGTTSFEDYIPAITFEIPDSNMTLKTTPWHGKGHMTSDAMTYFTEHAITVEVVNDEITVANVSNLAIEMDLKAGLQQIWEQQLYNGEANFGIQSFVFTDPMSNEVTTLDSVSMRFISSYDEDSSLGNLLFENTASRYKNTAFELKDIALHYELNNIQREFMKAYQTLSEDIVRSPENSETIMQAFMNTSVLQQLKVDPELNLPVIKAKVNDSSIDGFVKSHLTGIQTLPETISDRDFWIEHAVVDAKMMMETEAANFIAKQIIKNQIALNPQAAQLSEDEIERIAVQQSSVTIDGFVQQGILKKLDNGYEFTFTMKNANALLNGNPMPLPF